MRRSLVLLMLLGLAACAHPAAQQPNACQTWTRAAYINAAVAGRHLTQAQAATERDELCGVGN